MIYKLVKKIIFSKEQLFLLLLICNGCTAHNLQSVDQVMHDFINGEFELAQDKRAQNCVYRLDGVLKLGSEFTPDSSNPVVYIFWESDNIMVVKNYNISTKILDFDKAEAVVNYDLIFTTKDTPRYFEKEIRQEVVTYKLVRVSNEWKIVDPPSPRVSYDHLILFYLDQIDKKQKIVDSGKASNAQKESFDKIKSDYDVLKNI